MKFLTAFLLVGLVAIAAGGLIKGDTPEEKAEFQVVHKRCQDDPATHVDEKLIADLFKGIFANDQQLKVHMVCMAKGWKHMNEKGELNTELIKQQWSQHYDGQDFTNLLKCLVVKEKIQDTYYDMIKCKHSTVGHLQ